jgi:hypothetical protein
VRRPESPRQLQTLLRHSRDTMWLTAVREVRNRPNRRVGKRLKLVLPSLGFAVE